MPHRSTQMGHGICPFALAQRLNRLESELSTSDDASVDAHELVRAAIAERNPLKAVDIIGHYAGVLQSRGEVQELRHLYQQGIASLVDEFGRHHFSTLLVTYRLGTFLQGLRAFEEAETMYCESLHDMDDGNYYKPYFLHELGVAFAEQRKLQHAEWALKAALSGLLGAIAVDPRWTNTAAINLSDVCRMRGKLDDAAILLHHGLLGLEASSGPSDAVIASKAPRFMKIYHDYFRMGRLEDAWAVCSMALETFEDTFGFGDAMTLHVVKDLAFLSRELGMVKESKKLMQRSLPRIQTADISGLDCGTEPIFVFEE